MFLNKRFLLYKRITIFQSQYHQNVRISIIIQPKSSYFKSLIFNIKIRNYDASNRNPRTRRNDPDCINSSEIIFEMSDYYPQLEAALVECVGRIE